jgi:hypothetical protein
VLQLFAESDAPGIVNIHGAHPFDSEADFKLKSPSDYLENEWDRTPPKTTAELDERQIISQGQGE